MSSGWLSYRVRHKLSRQIMSALSTLPAIIHHSPIHLLMTNRPLAYMLIYRCVCLNANSFKQSMSPYSIIGWLIVLPSGDQINFSNRDSQIENLNAIAQHVRQFSGWLLLLVGRFVRPEWPKTRWTPLWPNGSSRQTLMVSQMTILSSSYFSVAFHSRIFRIKCLD